MPRFYPEYYEIWGYALASTVLVCITLIASAAIVRSRPSIGIWLLIVGALLVSGSLFVNDVGWLILAGGDGVIDGLNEPGRAELVGDLRAIEGGMIYLGAWVVVASLIFIGKDFVEIRRRSAMIQQSEQSHQGNRRQDP